MTVRQSLFTALVALIFGFAGAALWQYSGFGDTRTRAWLVDNPDILPDMAQSFERKQSEDRIAGMGAELATPFPGAVLGNPEGSVTLVEFTDYACSYCRQSHPDVKALLAENPDLRIVVREWPIFEGSDAAAKMALAAAEQGKYQAFHDAMFEGGRPSPEAVEVAARKAGLDMTRAREVAASSQVDFELAKNLSFAQKLGFAGTPSWVVGSQVLEGAVGRERLAEAIEQARES